MKKFFLGMLTLAVVALSASFVACSSDDDDSNDGGETSVLVGTWMIEYEKSMSGSVTQIENGENGTWFIFAANGTGYEEDHYSGETERWPIKWSYNEEEKTLTVIDVEDPKDTYTDTYEVLSLSSQKMVLRIYSEEFGFVKVR